MNRNKSTSCWIVSNKQPSSIYSVFYYSNWNIVSFFFSSSLATFNKWTKWIFQYPEGNDHHHRHHHQCIFFASERKLSKKRTFCKIHYSSENLFPYISVTNANIPNIFSITIARPKKTISLMIFVLLHILIIQIKLSTLFGFFFGFFVIINNIHSLFWIRSEKEFCISLQRSIPNIGNKKVFSENILGRTKKTKNSVCHFFFIDIFPDPIQVWRQTTKFGNQ